MNVNGGQRSLRNRMITFFFSFISANLPSQTVNKLPPELDTGVYFGWAKVENSPVYKMVMSIGWNPFYKNKEKSMEIHILHLFENDFYGCMLSVAIVGFIRPEMDFDNVESLIETIRNDIEIAEKELDKPNFIQYKSNPFFLSDNVM